MTTKTRRRFKTGGRYRLAPNTSEQDLMCIRFVLAAAPKTDTSLSYWIFGDWTFPETWPFAWRMKRWVAEAEREWKEEQANDAR